MLPTGQPAAVAARPLYKALDALLTAPLQPLRSTGEALRLALSRGQATYTRLAAAVQAVSGLWPGGTARLSHSLLRPAGLPLRPEDLALLGYGSGATVFSFTSGGRRWVLKVYRRSLGQRPAKVAAVATELRQKYQTLRAWYAGLLPPSLMLILHSPLLGTRAAAMLQPFLAGRLQDPFSDLSEQNLRQLLDTDEHLRDQFRFFARRTMQAYFEQGYCFDMLGHQNLVMEEDDNGRHLWIIDNGIFDVAYLEQRSPPVAQRLSERIAYLRALEESL
jgi:hypothetical protein